MFTNVTQCKCSVHKTESTRNSNRLSEKVSETGTQWAHEALWSTVEMNVLTATCNLSPVKLGSVSHSVRQGRQHSIWQTEETRTKKSIMHHHIVYISVAPPNIHLFIFT